jgi:hypothetical protein
MKKLGLILAGAALFDLGTIVASSQAETSSIYMKFKLDSMHTASMCVMDGGKVVTVGGAKFCQTLKEAPKGPAKKEG